MMDELRAAAERARARRSWRSMLTRCENPASVSYKSYGARGITVCERWHSFDAFYADMGGRPDGCSLDRIDNSKGYEPGNCRWATAIEQQNNKTNNVRIEAFGETRTLAEWSRAFGLEQNLVRDRIRNLGWPPEKALTVKDGRDAPAERPPIARCIRGHEYTVENTIFRKTRPGHRECRACKLTYRARRRMTEESRA